MRKEVENWWVQAKADFDAAEFNLKGNKLFVAAFLCQQSIEKALKAAYIKKNNELIRVHDLIFLAKKLDAPNNIIQTCDRLTRVYVETRYPINNVIPAKRFSREEVREFVKMAREVLDWLKDLL